METRYADGSSIDTSLWVRSRVREFVYVCVAAVVVVVATRHTRRMRRRRRSLGAARGQRDRNLTLLPGNL